MQKNRFADYDRVIHNDAEYQDQSEERDHVERAADGPQNEKGARDRHGYAHADPEREAQVKKDPEQKEDQA